jgi:hypothetical protein
MASAKELFPRLPLCEDCELHFTGPTSPSTLFLIFATEEGYHYERSRRQLEEAFIFGCEVCKASIESDDSYDDDERRAGGPGGLCFNEQRPVWYPSMSEVVSFRIQGNNTDTYFPRRNRPAKICYWYTLPKSSVNFSVSENEEHLEEIQESVSGDSQTLDTESFVEMIAGNPEQRRKMKYANPFLEWKVFTSKGIFIILTTVGQIPNN